MTSVNCKSITYEIKIAYICLGTCYSTCYIISYHILAADAPSRTEIPERKKVNRAANESILRLKSGRPIGAKDKNPRK